VSSPEHAGLTRSLPCNLLQRYLFSPTVPAQEFEKLLAQDDGTMKLHIL
jgi:EAL domain-containing protein (putative c-di-GMP-specific phosphodiesterase class I)